MRFSHGTLRRNFMQLAAIAAGSALSLSILGGCSGNPVLDSKSWIDPSELAGRVKKDTLVVPILDRVDPREEPRREFVTAQPPTQDDLNVTASDYVISKNDLLSIEISDLSGPGTQTVKTARVSESGNLSLPFVGQIKAEGLTEYELEQAIIKAYKDARILEKANVSVSVGEARGRAISILGAVNAPGQYALVDPDFRVLDALTLARDTQSPLLEDLYIIRRTDVNRASRPGGPAGTTPAPVPVPPGGANDLKPQGALDEGWNIGGSGPAHSSLINQHAPRAASAFQKAKPIGPIGPTIGEQDPINQRSLMLADTPGTGGTDENGRYTIIDGKKVYIGGAGTTAAPGSTAPAPAPAAVEPAPAPAPVPADTTTPPTPAPVAAPAVAAPADDATPAPSTGGFAFKELAAPENIRVIHIPLSRLRAGDLKYNVVIKPKDMIIVQNLPIGEYYMGGHVGQPGAYTLTQRRITLKQAVIAARMLDPLAIPQRTDLVRRLPNNQEIYVRVDLAAIFEGTASDIYLKPDDQVHVGTNALAPFIAALRSAFRFTYGFGFLYDRNFAQDENEGR